MFMLFFVSQIPVVKDIAIIFLMGFLVLFLAQKIKIPSILAFLITGLVIGPNGLALISGADEIDIMAEIGIVLLLFTIGMEFSIGSLKEIKKEVFIGGTLQVLLTSSIFSGMAMVFVPNNVAIFFGMFVALSSTAIVLKTLLNKGELSTKEGKASLSILIFQDLAVVPMMLILPMFSGQSVPSIYAIILLVVKAIGIIVFIVLLSRYVTNPVLDYIAKTRNTEFFLVFIIAVCAGVAMITGELGLSLGLGAFLAGFTLAESPYVHQAASNVIPFRDLFTIFFFVSIGMLLDLEIIIQFPLMILGILLAVIIVKSLIIMGILLIINYRLGQSLAVALTLAQVGEFSIVLSKVAFGYQIVDFELYQLILAVCLLSMSITPLLFWLSEKAYQIDLHRKRQVSLDLLSKSESHDLEHHIVIIGFGVIGRSVAKAAQWHQIPYAVVEMNAETVKVEKKLGTAIIYGDATQKVVLEHVHINKADILVVSIPDAQAVRYIVDLVSKNYESVHIIARTRFVSEVDHLLALGASEVIPDEFETSISLFNTILNRLGVDVDRRTEMISMLREDSYDKLRFPNKIFSDIDLKHKMLDGLCINKFIVEKNQPWVGKSLEEIKLRNQFGLNIIALITQNEQAISNPPPDTILHEKDQVVILGERELQQKWMNEWKIYPLS